MARKTKKQKAEDSIAEAQAKLLKWVMDSLAIMEPTTKPTDLKYVVDSWSKINGFSEPAKRDNGAIAEKKTGIADGDKVKDAFAALKVMSKDNPTITPDKA